MQEMGWAIGPAVWIAIVQGVKRPVIGAVTEAEICVMLDTIWVEKRPPRGDARLSAAQPLRPPGQERHTHPREFRFPSSQEQVTKVTHVPGRSLYGHVRSMDQIHGPVPPAKRCLYGRAHIPPVVCVPAQINLCCRLLGAPASQLAAARAWSGKPSTPCPGKQRQRRTPIGRQRCCGAPTRAPTPRSPKAAISSPVQPWPSHRELQSTEC